MRLFRPCFFTRWLFPGALFRIDTSEKTLCLTFDDGPDPGSTPELLGILNNYRIKAIFFCSGKAAEQYPELVQQIINEGHIIGNHGYNHLSGWKTSTGRYCNDVYKASVFTSDKLFRPPYGHIRLSQFRCLRKKFIIIFWDIMPYDFDKDFGAANAIEILKKKIRPGSIIVLHDTPDASTLEFIGEFLVYAINKGFRFGLPEF
jgi:peptidoglycan/xylan/chitin deacetylase (PgdA/CDA1 family)